MDPNLFYGAPHIDDNNIVVNPAKTVVLPPKGYAPDGGVFFCFLNMSTSAFLKLDGERWRASRSPPREYIVEHVVGFVRDGDPDRLARCLAEHAGQESASSSIPPSPSGREDKLLVSGVAGAVCVCTAASLEACRRRVDNQAQPGAYETNPGVT